MQGCWANVKKGNNTFCSLSVYFFLSTMHGANVQILRAHGPYYTVPTTSLRSTPRRLVGIVALIAGAASLWMLLLVVDPAVVLLAPTPAASSVHRAAGIAARHITGNPRSRRVPVPSYARGPRPALLSQHNPAGQGRTSKPTSEAKAPSQMLHLKEVLSVAAIGVALLCCRMWANKRPSAAATPPLALMTVSGAAPGLPEFFDNLTGKTQKREACRAALLDSIAPTNCGASASPDAAQAIDRLAAELEALNPTSAPTSGAVAGDWQLIYTTEADVHAFMRLPVGAPDVGQQVDLDGRRVQNRILFAGSSGLRAGGPLETPSKKRITYNFDTVEVVVLGLAVRLPIAITAGWTDTTYLDGVVRVQRNSRGDLLVYERL